MLGASGGIKVWIELHSSREFYTNGDHLYGTLFVESAKPFSIHNIEVKLRCEEQAYVWVNNSQGGYYEVETLRHLSLKSVLFPKRDVMLQKQSEGTYTLQSGTHNFDFQFEIPFNNSYPGSLQVRNSQSGIRWYVKGVVHRGNMLTASKRTTAPIKVAATPSPNYQGDEMTSESCDVAMTVFLPSYSEIAKTTAGKLRGLLPSSQFKKRTNVRMTITLPAGGILQHPEPLCLELDIGSGDDELLLLKGVTLYLKQKIIVSVADGWHTSVHRENFHLWTSSELNLSLKEGLKTIYEKLMDVCINGRLYETFSNRHFQVNYKLVAEAVVACREKPSSTLRLRLSIPVVIHNFLSGRGSQAMRHEDEHSEELPTYRAEPRIGEETVEVNELKD